MAFIENSSATDNFDFGYDAKNIDTYATDVSWSIDDANFIIQGVGEFDSTKQYPLNVVLAQTGNLDISLRVLENFNQDIDVFIYDALTDEYTQFNEVPFSINLNAGEYNSRFFLTFEADDTLSIINKDLQNIIVNYLNNSEEIYINTPQHINVKQVYLTNIIGQTIKSWNATNTTISSEFKIPVKKIADGNYIIKVVTNQGTYNKKVVITLD